jgi:uncharacterized protein (DUF697 family)
MASIFNWSAWDFWRSNDPPDEERYRQQLEQLEKQAPVPVLWLFGKTGSGKSSVVRYLTGAEQAVVGEGFRPETRRSRQFDFPDSEQPLLRFLDTRGLGEVDYDPSEDIAHFDQTTELIIVTVRVTDHALQGVIEPLKAIRQSAPGRPILLVLTCLHQVPGCLHISAGPDPFDGSQPPQVAEDIPQQLKSLLQAKAEQFEGLVDRIIPVDLTKPQDGFADPNFGGQRLRSAILEHLPQAYRQALLALRDLTGAAHSERQRRSQRQVLASSALAASAGAIPLPYVDIPAVIGIQAHLAYRIAAIYNQEITRSNWAVLGSVAGSRVVTRLLIRETLKFIPILGIAASAAGAFVFTYAIGMSWDWYFSRVLEGEVPTTEALREVFSEQLQFGKRLWESKPQ